MPLFVALSYTCGIMVYNPKEYKIYTSSNKWLDCSTGGSQMLQLNMQNSDITSNTEAGSFMISILYWSLYIINWK